MRPRSVFRSVPGRPGFRLPGPLPACRRHCGDSSPPRWFLCRPRSRRSEASELRTLEEFSRVDDARSSFSSEARDGADRAASTLWLLLFRTVAMHDFDAVTCAAEVLADFFGDHDGAMLSTGATEGDSQVALAFVDVMREQVDEQ